MASSASGQDEPNRALWLATRAGKMEPSCPLGTTRCIPQAKFPQKSYNKSFIDQVCSVKMAGYWPRSFFCEFMDLDYVSVHKHAKKGLGQYPAILTEQTWSITHTSWPLKLLSLLQQSRGKPACSDGVYRTPRTFGIHFSKIIQWDEREYTVTWFQQ